MSPFARTLARLFDETSFFTTRDGWAAFFGIPVASLDDWTNDRSIPVAHLLRMGLDLLAHSRAWSTAVIDAEAVFLRPIADVSPLAPLFEAPTVHQYLTGSTLAGFAARLATLPPDAQCRALVGGSWTPC